MNDLGKQIELEITKTLRELKTDLFDSSGQTLGRNWEDLTPKYKKWKKKLLGYAYPINILTGYLLQSLVDNAIKVNVNYDESSDTLSFNINLDTDRIGLEYAEYVNDKREYISLSDEEKKFINELVIDIVQSHFEGMQ